MWGALTGCTYVVTWKYSCSLYPHNAELWGRVLVSISAQYWEKWQTSVRYWRKTQGSTPCDAETSDGEWMLIMLNWKRQHMPTATTAVHKNSVQTYMHRILCSAIWAQWHSCQQVPFTALQKFLRKMKYVAYVFCCPPPFPVLVTFWWSISHGCIHMTCNWRAKWWEEVSHLTT